MKDLQRKLHTSTRPLSAYEQERERNIERNKALISSLGLDKTSKVLATEETKATKRKADGEEVVGGGDKKKKK